MHLLSRLADGEVLILDGAMGTSVHAIDLPLSAYDGRENCPEILNLTRPDAIEQIHRSFLAVGCDAVETNTFGASRHVLVEFDLAEPSRAMSSGRSAREPSSSPCARSTTTRCWRAISSRCTACWTAASTRC
jgi:5-methyltetrahydrofolate--homocysteine methyltransferase